MNSYLEKSMQEKLREQGHISQNEVVLVEGDLFIVLNVIDNSRRMIQLDRTLLESRNQKQLLKG